MVRVRAIPCLQLARGSLVKTVKFANPQYIGDPLNTARIFNELEVDELAVIDIEASRQGREPQWGVLQDLANECFMPLSYGGGIADASTAGRLYRLGFEKLILNTAAVDNTPLLTELSRCYGSQAVIGAIDVRKTWSGRYAVTSRSGTRTHRLDPEVWAKRLEDFGVGEILLTSVDREGTWRGYDIALTARVCAAVRVPVIANGGAGSLDDVKAVLTNGGASAVALGSMVVYQGKDRGVLVNFPETADLARALDHSSHLPGPALAAK